jgi:hypothetical protein
LLILSSFCLILTESTVSDRRTDEMASCEHMNNGLREMMFDERISCLVSNPLAEIFGFDDTSIALSVSAGLAAVTSCDPNGPKECIPPSASERRFKARAKQIRRDQELRAQLAAEGIVRPLSALAVGDLLGTVDENRLIEGF